MGLNPPRALVVGAAGVRAAVRALLPAAAGEPVEVESVGEAAEALLATRFTLAVLDLRTADGLAVLRRIKGAAATRMLPALALCGKDEPSVVAALDAGADHAVPFPPSPADFEARARALLRSRQSTERLEDTTAVIFALANAVEAKDAYTEGHTERVGALAVEIARLAGLDEDAQEALRQGGVLHDIGKIGIPNEIINKAGRLTDRQGADLDEQASAHRRAHLRAAPLAAPPVAHHPRAPRTAGRQRLPRRAQGR
jgi:putative two-component system response regulator